MVKLSNQTTRKALSTDKRMRQNFEFNVVLNHDVRSVATMLGEVMQKKSDGAWAKDNQ